MTSRLVFLAVLVFSQSATACPERDGAQPLSSLDAAAPAAFVAFDELPISAPFEMTVEFCGDAGAHIAAMAFDAFMPAHQHGMNYHAEISEKGEQSFLISNVVFHMPGRWELRIDAEATGQNFAYTGEVAVE